MCFHFQNLYCFVAFFFMKCVISSWLGKNMIPLLRDGNLEHLGSSLEPASLAYTMLGLSPLALAKVVNSYKPHV